MFVPKRPCCVPMKTGDVLHHCPRQASCRVALAGRGALVSVALAPEERLFVVSEETVSVVRARLA